MEHTGYRVVLTGIRQGMEKSRVAEELATAFRTTPEKMTALLADLPFALKENIDHATALKYQKIITAAGGASRVEPVTAGFAATAGNASNVLKVCPNCGYNDVSPDPLVSAFQGGECSACGVILARFDQEREGRTTAKSASPGLPAGSNAGKPALSINWKMLSLALVLIAIGGYFLLSGGGTSEPGKKVPLGRIAQAAAMSKGLSPQNPDSSVRILPGESKVIRISGYLKLFHEESTAALELEPMWSEMENTWKERGIEVEKVDATVTHQYALLWEHPTYDSSWSPATPEWSSQIHNGWRLIATGAPKDRPRPGKLLRYGNVHALKNMSEMTHEQVVAFIKKSGREWPELRQNGYILYKVNLEFSIRVPAGAEFESRNLTRLDEHGREISVTAHTGTILLKLAGLDSPGMGFALVMDEGVNLEVCQVTEKEGVFLRVATASFLADCEMLESRL